MTKDEVANRIVRIEIGGGPLGLFACSSITVGEGIAGEFIDSKMGAVVPLVNIIEIVDPGKAKAELDAFLGKKDQERIRQVIVNTDEAQQEFQGTIILHVAFTGSLAKSKSLTKAESELLKSDALIGTAVRAKIKERKTLFESQEYDAIELFKQKRRLEFANLGIPFPLGDSMYLLKIVNIPKAEALAARTQVELSALVQSLQGVYASQITLEAVGLGPLYNAGDYRAPEALEALFKFRTKWMHFGVPDVLREIDAALWESERQRTAEVWQEAKEQGLILLRETLAKMVKRLVEAVSPDERGNKKRFYATAVTSLTDFFDAFEDRNFAGDEDVAALIEQLKALVEGRDISAFKDDDALRAFVQKEGGRIQDSLEEMLVLSGARTITFEE